ncbi:hypothetical protein FBZ86_14013 [Gluconacetobacter diazotrophicus]|nr:hypothetical protein FBZ86_14013 [Gluconacetobacter diazotrophicus]
MKLCRYGEPGQERPALVTRDEVPDPQDLVSGSK